MKDRRKQNLANLASTKNHVIQVIDLEIGRSSLSKVIVAAIALFITVIAAIVLPSPYQVPGALLVGAVIYNAFVLKTRKGFQFSRTGFTILHKELEPDNYDWDEVESFGFDQKSFGMGILTINLTDERKLFYIVSTPEYDPNIGKIIDIFESHLPVSKPRYFNLFRKGQHFVENKPIGYGFLVPGSIMLAAGFVFTFLPGIDPTLRGSSICLLMGVGVSAAGIGLDILLRIARPPLKNTLSEPIIFSKMPDRLTKIFSIGGMFFFLWIVFSIPLSALNTPYVPLYGLAASLLVTLFYNLRLASWSSFEEVVVTEGRIKIRKFRKVYTAFISDLDIEVRHGGLLNRLILKTDDWKVEISDHVVAGDKLSDILEKLKSGEKLRPILSEEHPGFKFEYNDAD